ncbi:hypothetical protein [Algoriphagus boritolerans]|uniref:hypothetical protein n=1 Tax=Algoriphagus boritolerans TaxID=308111 RepID=UPI003A0FEE75
MICSRYLGNSVLEFSFWHFLWHFFDLGVFEQEPWWVLPILYFVALGIINAINFMDGINGMSGVYGLVFFRVPIKYL